MAAKWHLDDPRRLAAVARGDKRWLGPPCAHGHEGWRYTSVGDCVDCTSERAAAHRLREEEQKGELVAPLDRSHRDFRPKFVATSPRRLPIGDSIIAPIPVERLMARR